MTNINAALVNMHRNLVLNDYVENKMTGLLSSFLEDSSSPSKAFAEFLPRIAQRISGQIEHIHHDGDLSYKEAFAHHHCYYLVNGFMSLLGEADCEPEALVMIDNAGNAAHYLVKATIADKVCYIDAYGIHSNTDMITSRYRDTTIVEIVAFDPCDDSDPHYQTFIDKVCDLYDMAEGVLAENGNEPETEDTVDFLEFVESAMALETFGFCLTHDIADEF